ncbi:hypothetical protein NHX12_033015 [Muraenolepis orangiensis]|uniref:MHD domain-containing protein n=1 Tax=Muraenolepis orangiensis TaxID=630683 RepID=A0A9Q0IFY4_9TELE|nr:hypothetical protein NHX12_033015 [Muraenolepis orangiensis]
MSVFHSARDQEIKTTERQGGLTVNMEGSNWAFVLGLKKRTRKAFGMRKKEKDNDSTGSPEREGGSQKKTNGAANGFTGEIDWERYNSPEVDEEGYSVRPDEEEEAADILVTLIALKTPHFFSSDESEEEEDQRKKFKIKIKPLPADCPVAAPSVDQLKTSIGNIALFPSPMGVLKKTASSEEIVRPRRPVPAVPAPASQSPSSQQTPVPEDATSLFGPPLETAFGEQETEVALFESDMWGAPLSEPQSSLARPLPTGTPPPLPPKNVPTSPPTTGPASPFSTEMPSEAECSTTKPSIADLDNIFGPEEASAVGDEAGDKWVCFSEKSPERSPSTTDPEPPLTSSPPPPLEDPAPPPLASPPSLEDPAPPPLASPPSLEDPAPPQLASPPSLEDPAPPQLASPPSPEDPPTPPPATPPAAPAVPPPPLHSPPASSTTQDSDAPLQSCSAITAQAPPPHPPPVGEPRRPQSPEAAPPRKPEAEEGPVSPRGGEGVSGQGKGRSAAPPPPPPTYRTAVFQSVNSYSRPFSPPVHSASSPPIAPLARAESTSSVSSTNSLSAATTPTVGKELSVSVSEDDAYVDKLPTFERNFESLAGCSRGPSPLTMGAQDTLPVAAAFTETVNAFFKGADTNKCVVKIIGEMVLSFPAGITRHFANNPSPAVLTFSITNYSRLEHVLPNPQLLCCHLKKVSEQKPQATYYNVDMLKYQAASTDLRIDYKYNGDAMSNPMALNNVQFLIPVDGGVSKLQAVLPPAQWNAEHQRILWKIPDISQKSDNGGVGSLLARFRLSEGPSKPAPLAVQFTSEGSTLSGCDIELAGPGYRFSLIKKRFAAGKYLADN